MPLGKDTSLVEDPVSYFVYCQPAQSVRVSVKGMQYFSQPVANFSQESGKHPVRALKPINSKAKMCHMDIYGVNSKEFRKKLPIEKPFVH